MTTRAAVIKGGCHCKAVRFEVRVKPPLEILRCNCSICRMQGFEHILVSDEDFTLVQGEQELSEYTFNTGTARHWFCSHCGIKAFYKPRSHPEGISVNARCVDSLDNVEHVFTDFDGDNWEANVQDIRA